MPTRVRAVQQLYTFLQGYWKNGSAMNSTEPPSWVTVFAVGNWSLVTSMMSTYLGPSTRIVDGESEWSMEIDQFGPEVGMITNITISFLKSDGALYKWNQTIHDFFADKDVFYCDITRVTGGPQSGPGLGLEIPTLIAVASIPIEIVVAAVLIKKYRR